MSTAGQQEGKRSNAQRASSKRKARGSRCPQGKGHQRRSKLTITNPDAAGIDIGAQVHYAAVPVDRAEVSVRSFGAYTAQLDELVQWLKIAELNRGDGIDRSLLDPVVPEARRGWF